MNFTGLPFALPLLLVTIDERLDSISRPMNGSTMDEAPLVDLAKIADDLRFTHEQVQNVTRLLDEANTVPFITRYRKEQTGNLDEEQIRAIQQRVQSQRQLAERAETILRLIDTQGKLTPALRQTILEADSLKRLEDLYLPYRPKRKSRAIQARSRGLGPLAERIWNQDPLLEDPAAAAAEFIDPENDLPTAAEVLQGTADIIAERMSEDAELRDRARKTAWQTGQLTVTPTKAGKEKGQLYRDYFDYCEAVKKIPPHRVLALNRGEKEGALRVKFDWDDGRIGAQIATLLKLMRHRFGEFMQRCATDSLSRLIQPSLERELRRELTDRAEAHAVSVFAMNLRNLLLQPPLKGRRVLAIDPAFRTGCKVAVLDEMGSCLANDVLYITASDEQKLAARQTLAKFVEDYQCTLIAIGNGTACRETEEFVSELIAEELPELRYTIVNEAGASIYSTSSVGRDELPDLDATVRGTISIGRRLQDPLSELVKIDPQHIGVGMYQHDVSPRMLKESLDRVIESCVNYVGVDVNTASVSLLRRVSGLNQLIARRLVEWRDSNGRFCNRRQLLEVQGVGEATFRQAAGFLKISDGDNPLDATWIHPESYDVTDKVLERLSLSPDCLLNGNSNSNPLRDRLAELNSSTLARELNVGVPTLDDILEALSRPDRDPRTDLDGPVFKQGILKLDDLSVGMELTGTVLNVVDFGVFVDIGLKDSGLVHISQMAIGYIENPHGLAAVGDVVTIWVLGVDQQRRRVSLTMIKPGSADVSKRQPKSASRKSKRARTRKRSKVPASVVASETSEDTSGCQPVSEQQSEPPVRVPETGDVAEPVSNLKESIQAQEQVED